MSSSESLEHYQENIAFAQRIKHAIQLHPRGSYGLNEHGGKYKDPTAGELMIFDLSETITDAGRIYEIPARAPKWFRIPFFSFERYGDDPDMRFSSRYGAVPPLFIGEDGIPYGTRNYYYFNEFGQGIRYEDITRFYDETKSPEENVKEFSELIDESTPRLPIQSLGEDSRLAPLELGDYELIGMALHMIESGIYIPY